MSPLPATPFAQGETEPLHRDEPVTWLSLEKRPAQVRFELTRLVSQNTTRRDGYRKHEANYRVACLYPLKDRHALLDLQACRAQFVAGAAPMTLVGVTQ